MLQGMYESGLFQHFTAHTAFGYQPNFAAMWPEATMRIAFQPVFEPVKHFAAHIAFGYQPNFVAMWLEAAMRFAFQPVFESSCPQQFDIATELKLARASSCTVWIGYAQTWPLIAHTRLRLQLHFMLESKEVTLSAPHRMQPCPTKKNRFLGKRRSKIYAAANVPSCSAGQVPALILWCLMWPSL